MLSCVDAIDKMDRIELNLLDSFDILTNTNNRVGLEIFGVPCDILKQRTFYVIKKYINKNVYFNNIISLQKYGI